MEDSAELLVRLGMKEYEARVFAALIPLGPSGVSEISRSCGVPRNKVYEAVRGLSKKGMVEVQPGRPLIFRATRPRDAIARLVEQFELSAKEATERLEKEIDVESEGDDEHVWVVTGRQAIMKRLAESISEANSTVFAMEPYPPDLLLSARKLLQKAVARGVNVRAICVVVPGSYLERSDDRIIEYRALQKPSQGDKSASMFMKSARMASTFVVDDALVLDIVKSQRNPDRISGVITSVPGAPFFQRMAIEGLADVHTKRIR